MSQFEITHEFESDPQTFWALFFDVAYNDAFYRSAAVAYRVIEDREGDVARERVTAFRPIRPLPAVVHPFVNGDLEYIERVSFDKRTEILHQRVEPAVFRDKVSVTGTVVVESIERARIRRIYRGEVSVRLPVIGKRIEGMTIRAMKNAQDRAAAVTREWLAKSHT